MSGGKTRTAKVLKAIAAVKRSDMPAEEKACAILTMTRFLEQRRKMMEIKEGYILYNAEGKKPESMLAAFKEGDGVKVVIEGNGTEILGLFACLAADFITEGICDSEDLMNLIRFAKTNGDDTAMAFVTLLEEVRSDEET